MKPVSAREGTVRPAAKRGQPSEEGARTQVRLQSAGLRWLLLVSGVLVLLAGVQLFVFTERTDEYFAWTVVPPVSAAFLGAGYFAAMAMEWVAVRQRTWVSARLVAVTIFFFASLTTTITSAWKPNTALNQAGSRATRGGSSPGIRRCTTRQTAMSGGTAP